MANGCCWLPDFACNVPCPSSCPWNTPGDASSSTVGIVCPVSLPLSQASGGTSSCGLGSQSMLGNFLGSLLAPLAKAGVNAGVRKLCIATCGPSKPRVTGTVSANSVLLIGAVVVSAVVIFGLRK